MNILINFAAETHVDNSMTYLKNLLIQIFWKFNQECTRSYLKNNNLKNFKFIQISLMKFKILS